MVSNDLKTYNPDIVRVGPTSSTNTYVKEVTLDTIVNHYITTFTKDPAIIKKLLSDINRLNPEINNNSTDDTRLAALYEEYNRKTIDIQRYRIVQQYKLQNSDKFPDEELRQSILNETHIVFTTLSGSGMRIFTQLKRPFDIVVIDEAAQAVELSTLIPLLRGNPSRCILVGDPKQLPATVLSEFGKDCLYQQSMFERFQKCGVHSYMLTIQYRMHPEIRKFPSKYFYEDKLVDGENVKADYYSIFDRKQDLRFRPFLFYDVSSKERKFGNSYVNEVEAKWAVAFYMQLRSAFQDIQVLHFKYIH